jgi:death-on-curing protein
VPIVRVIKSIVLAIHDEQLSEHGGPPGIRDENGLESALARPLHLLTYNNPDLFDLAASYAVGLAQRQHFFDGNKRVSAVVTELFLDLNGHTLVADDAEIVELWKSLAANRTTEDEIVIWLRDRAVAI